MNIQEYLVSGGDINQLCTKYCLKTRRHKLYPNLILFKYSDSSKHLDSPYVKEARGLILDENDSWKIISYPYDKFFNLGEKNSAQINLTESRIYDKLDGRLMILYYYKSEWIVSSSGMPDSSGLLANTNMTLGDKFWQVFNVLNYQLPSDTNLCYIFELILHSHPILIVYEKDDLILHGARNLTSYIEYDPIIIAELNGYKCVNIIQFDTDTTTDALKQSVNQLDYKKYEGYIVCDKNFNRIKLKSKSYVEHQDMVNRITKSLNKNIIDVKSFIKFIVNVNDKNEVIVYFPEFVSVFERVEQCIDDVQNEIIDIYNKLKHYKDDRDFAIESKKYWCHTILQKIRKINKKQCELEINVDLVRPYVLAPDNKSSVRKLNGLLNKNNSK